MRYIEAMDEHRDLIKENINDEASDENIINYYCPPSFFEHATGYCVKNVKFDANVTCEQCWNREIEVSEDVEGN